MTVVLRKVGGVIKAPLWLRLAIIIMAIAFLGIAKGVDSASTPMHAEFTPILFVIAAIGCLTLSIRPWYNRLASVTGALAIVACTGRLGTTIYDYYTGGMSKDFGLRVSTWAVMVCAQIIMWRALLVPLAEQAKGKTGK